MLDLANGTKLAAIGITTAAIYTLTRHIYARQSHDRNLPPGPPGLPILGNVLQVPTTVHDESVPRILIANYQHLATYFRRLLEEYGGLVSLNFAGTPVILVGDFDVAKELLDKNSSKNSSRPQSYYVNQHVDPTNDYWAFGPDDATHAIGRKLTARVMSDVRAGKTESLQTFEALLNIEKLLDDGGKDWWKHMERYSASVVFSAVYGMHCPTGQEPELQTIFGTLEEIVHYLTPNATIINAFPFLDWLPGPLPWRLVAQALRKRDQAIHDKLVNYAVTGEASGMNTWAATFAGEGKPEGDQRRLLKQFAAAAIDSTTITLHTFVLACILHPDWISAAQHELDAVVGPDRMPSFKDRPFLPYIEAVVRETLRWRPAVRFGIAHQSRASTVIQYKGQEYSIPQGSTIFAVTWAIEHNQAKFEDHDRFMPERFLDAHGNLRSNYETSAFGFGRRVCPGSIFAERSLWIDVATLLWTFNIQGTNDHETGLPFKYDDSDAAFIGDFTSTPLKFPAAFEPRSPQHAEVAKREWAECEKDLNKLLPLPKPHK